MSIKYRCFALLALTLCVAAGASALSSTAAAMGASSSSAQARKPAVDTGVGKNGETLPSNPAFTATGGAPVTMDNVVRAETANFSAETLQTPVRGKTSASTSDEEVAS